MHRQYALRALLCVVLACSSVCNQAEAKRQIAPGVANLGKGFVSKTAHVHGTTLHDVRGGTGPAVIVLHGFPQDWYEFHPIMPRLATHFTVLAVDLRGGGGSAATPDGYEAVNFAADVHQLAQQLRLERPYIAGHDLGGMVAYAFARRYPTHVRGVMILDVPLPGLEPWAEVKANPVLWHVGFHQTPNVPETLRAGRQFVYVRAGIFNRFTASNSAITDADVTHCVTSYAAPQHLRAGMEFLRAFPANEQLNQEQQSPVDVPIVLAGGDKTFGQLLPRIAEALRKHGCTHVTTEVIQDSGHDVVDEQPTRVAELIERYALR